VTVSLSQFDGQHYISVETFKRNGDGVKTPVWFVEENNSFYIWTMAKSGKVRRIRNNPRVRIAPCSILGRPKGTWVDAEAHVAANNQAQRPAELIKKKYGIQFWLVSNLNRAERLIVEINEIK
jgi:hypothetical protein